MEEQTIHMSYKTYNILCVVVSCGIILWGIQASLNFYKMLQIRAAVLSDDVALLRGLGDNLRPLNNVSTSHAQSLLHTRQATPPSRVSTVVQSTRITSAVWTSRTALRVDISRNKPFSCLVIPVAGLDTTESPPTANSPSKAIIDTLLTARVCRWAGRAVTINGADAASSIVLDFADAPAGSTALGVLLVPIEVAATPVIINVTDVENGLHSEVQSRCDGNSGEGSGDVEMGSVSGASSSLRRRIGQRRGDSTSIQQHLSFQTIKYSICEIKPPPARNGVSSGDVLGDVYLNTGGSCYYKVHSIYGGAPTATTAPSTDAVQPSLSNTEHAQRSPLAARQAGTDHTADESCVVCLTDRKEVLLLPCRHICVCSSCLPLIDKCPVCRAAFNIYLVMQQPEVTVAI